MPNGKIYSIADIVARPAIPAARHDPRGRGCRTARRSRSPASCRSSRILQATSVGRPGARRAQRRGLRSHRLFSRPTSRGLRARKVVLTTASTLTDAGVGDGGEPDRDGGTMSRTHRALLALLAVVRARPRRGARRSARAQGRPHRRGRQGRAVLPAADHHRAAGLLQGRRAQRQISDFAGGTRSLRAVVGGSADVVSGAYEHTINMQSRKQSLPGLRASWGARRRSASASRRKAAKYKSPKDLKGLKVGVSAPGSSTNMVVNYFARAGRPQADRRVDHRRRRRAPA